MVFECEDSPYPTVWRLLLLAFLWRVSYISLAQYFLKSRSFQASLDDALKIYFSRIDIAECLSVGSHYMKSTIHADTSGGDSDYFDRPVTRTTTIVTIFRKDEIYIGVVPNENFPGNLTGNDIDKMIDVNTLSESDFTIA